MLVALAGQAQAFSLHTYTNYSAWLEAIDPIMPIVEDFEDASLKSGLTIKEVNNSGLVQDGLYKGVVASGSPTMFTFERWMFAFGGWFDLTVAGYIRKHIRDTSHIY